MGLADGGDLQLFQGSRKGPLAIAMGYLLVVDPLQVIAGG